MRVLVIHQNFPGQFGHLVSAWSKRQGWDVRGLGRDTAPGLLGFDKLQRYRLARQPHKGQHAYLRQMEAATLHGQATARAMLEMRQSGFTPDVILAHPGWGETLYAKDVFPDARLVHFCEWYYSAEGADLGFDPEFPISFDTRARIRTWNALHTLNLTQCDAAVTPTHWQHSRHPAIFHDKITVQHEGIPTHLLGPDPKAQITTPSGLVLHANDPQRPVITYVARNLEPYRGFHMFMRTLAVIQRSHPTCQAVIVGGDEVSYGSPSEAGTSWREKMLKEVRVDLSRTHFMGRISYANYQKVLQISSAHIYLSYPFALSWSMLEAMASGALLIGSNTLPVQEMVSHLKNGLLVEFFDNVELAETTLDALKFPNKYDSLRSQAMADVAKVSLQRGIIGYENLIKLRG